MGNRKFIGRWWGLHVFEGDVVLISVFQLCVEILYDQEIYQILLFKHKLFCFQDYFLLDCLYSSPYRLELCLVEIALILTTKFIKMLKSYLFILILQRLHCCWFVSLRLIIEQRVFDWFIEGRVVLLEHYLADSVDIGSPFSAKILFLIMEVSYELDLLDKELGN